MVRKKGPNALTGENRKKEEEKRKKRGFTSSGQPISEAQGNVPVISTRAEAESINQRVQNLIKTANKPNIIAAEGEEILAEREKEKANFQPIDAEPISVPAPVQEEKPKTILGLPTETGSIFGDVGASINRFIGSPLAQLFTLGLGSRVKAGQTAATTATNIAKTATTAETVAAEAPVITQTVAKVGMVNKIGSFLKNKLVQTGLTIFGLSKILGNPAQVLSTRESELGKMGEIASQEIRFAQLGRPYEALDRLDEWEAVVTQIENDILKDRLITDLLSFNPEKTDNALYEAAKAKRTIQNAKLQIAQSIATGDTANLDEALIQLSIELGEEI